MIKPYIGWSLLDTLIHMKDSLVVSDNDDLAREASGYS